MGFFESPQKSLVNADFSGAGIVRWISGCNSTIVVGNVDLYFILSGQNEVYNRDCQM